MNARPLLRWLAVMMGPELLWWLTFEAIILLVKASYPPSPLTDKLMRCLPIVMPVIAALPFLSWYIPFTEKRWLLVRIWVAGIIGAHLTLPSGMAAYSKGHETGTMYLAGMVLTVFVLLVGSLFVQLQFRSRTAGRP
ncbi:hypothetical protein [Fibrella arboris]|uniref:hypothetical protein n=1 Tax=Fibrella arboris TaxID=3242486 RepID=UPI0035219D2E